MAFLPSFFGDRLISTGLWSPRSCDLNSLDFCVWGMLKDKVYTTAPITYDDLKQLISKNFQSLLRLYMGDCIAILKLNGMYMGSSTEIATIKWYAVFSSIE